MFFCCKIMPPDSLKQGSDKLLGDGIMNHKDPRSQLNGKQYSNRSLKKFSGRL